MSKFLKNITFGTEMMDAAEILEKIRSVVTEFETKVSELTAIINSKQDKLFPGSNIKISGNVISASSSGGSSGGMSEEEYSQMKSDVDELKDTSQVKLKAGSGLSLSVDGTIAANLMLDLTTFEGFFNPGDSNFYEDNSYQTKLQIVPGAIYVDKNTGRTWLYKSVEVGYVQMPFVTMQYVESQLHGISSALDSLSVSAASLLD